jgi:hypothetical protein
MANQLGLFAGHIVLGLGIGVYSFVLFYSREFPVIKAGSGIKFLLKGWKAQLFAFICLIFFAMGIYALFIQGLFNYLYFGIGLIIGIWFGYRLKKYPIL